MTDSNNQVRVAIVGALGYGGVGATEILSRHPLARIAKLLDITDVGTPISAIYPHLAGVCDLPIGAMDAPDLHDGVDLVFFSTPDGVGQALAPEWLKRGIKVIDYSGDFRFNDAATYAGYARRIGKEPNHQSAALLPESVFGVPEFHRERIAKARLIGNPGCFAMATMLGLAPAVKAGLVDPATLICDAKTGVSGAGKKPAPGFHYPARYEATNAYRISGHQHVYEIERELSRFAGRDVMITFTPHVVPMTRGILATLYADLKGSLDDLVRAYEDFYRGEPFVIVQKPGGSASTTDVRGSNRCRIWVNADPRTKKAIIVSHIDNLLKGQAGNAVQNMNICMGLPETAGLDGAGQYP
jgi:N-acetyl-gamma-glutamyl-phosphate reductase